MATREEQLVLAKFVGWGGLANALTPEKEGWEKEYEEIESLLSEEEMQSVSASTLTSYYTDQNVINYIYKALQNFGFQSGNILDKTTPRLIQFHTFKNAANPPFLGGFSIFSIVAA